MFSHVNKLKACAIAQAVWNWDVPDQHDDASNLEHQSVRREVRRRQPIYVLEQLPVNRVHVHVASTRGRGGGTGPPQARN